MRPELLSTARPSRLRILSFLGLAVGGALLGLGALLPWAVLTPFEQTTSHGTDLWEGLLALVAGVGTLAGMIVLRLVRSRRWRQVLALAIVAVALVAGAAAASFAARAEERLSSPDERERIARELARATGVAFEDVRAEIERQFGLRFAVELRSGVWLVIAGAAAAALGGAVSVAWARRS